MGKHGRTDETNRRELAAMVSAVLDRLHADPEVQVLHDDGLQLFGVADFFSKDECERVMEMIDRTARPSPVFNVDYGKGARTSYSGDLNAGDPFVQSLHRRMDDLIGAAERWGETMQGQRYAVGQEFKAHHDWFDTRQPYFKGEVAMGGQRAWTLMVYLNDVEAGGATEFPKVQIAIPPQQGTLIIWANTDTSGKVNMDTLHAGTPVVAGTKYVVTRWYRARPWY